MKWGGLVFMFLDFWVYKVLVFDLILRWVVMSMNVMRLIFDLFLTWVLNLMKWGGLDFCFWIFGFTKF